MCDAPLGPDTLLLRVTAIAQERKAEPAHGSPAVDGPTPRESGRCPAPVRESGPDSRRRPSGPGSRRRLGGPRPPRHISARPRESGPCPAPVRGTVRAARQRARRRPRRKSARPVCVCARPGPRARPEPAPGPEWAPGQAPRPELRGRAALSPRHAPRWDGRRRRSGRLGGLRPPRPIPSRAARREDAGTGSDGKRA